jgi:ABC-type transporter Mla MlaB component
MPTMLRITIDDLTPEKTRLTLEGRLVGPWVTVLRQECRALSCDRREVSLNLAHVTFVDASGVSLLRRLSDEGIAVHVTSAFVSELLNPGTIR